MSNIAEKLTKIAENVPKVYKSGYDTGYDEGHEVGYAAGQSSMVDQSKLIPKTVSGSYISVDDVSEIPHSVACKVKSVNLCPINNKTFTTNYWYEFKQPLPAGQYTMSGKFTTEHPDNQFLVIFQNADRANATNKMICFDIPDDKKYTCSFTALEPISWVFGYAANGYANALNYKASIANFQLNKGTEALPYTPYVSPESVSVTRTGRSLFDAERWYDEMLAKPGNASYPISKGVDGEYEYIKVHPVSVSNRIGYLKDVFKENTQYTLSFVAKTDTANVTGLYLRYVDGGNASIMLDSLDWKSYSVTSEAGKTVESIGITWYSNGWGYYSNLALNEGTTALPYEPYNGQTLTPATDGAVEGMTSVSPYMNVFTDNAGATLEATYRMSWGMQEERERFCSAFRQGVINHSISFEWLALDKANTTSVINALSDTVTGQTLTLNLAAVNAAFETSSGVKDGSTSTEFAALVATKPNWTIVLK